MQTDLSSYNNSWYKSGSFVKKILWYYTSVFFFRNGLFPFYRLKIFLLKVFGAKIGHNVLIKPFVQIKYPWLLTIGDNVWIGEEVCIDNLASVSIGNNVCISQGAMLLTGNHDFTKITFDLFLKNIVVANGVWIGARSIVCPGVMCKTNSLLLAGTVATKDLEHNTIYRGNPAEKYKERFTETGQ